MISSVDKHHLKFDNFSVSDEHTIVVAYDERATSLVPGNGGTRWRFYSNLDQQIQEALILAERMSVKHSLYKTGFYGAKFVINGPKDQATERSVLQALAKIINRYDGRLYTGCDLNVNNEDMIVLSEDTPFVLNSLTNPAIDTSAATGAGVFAAVRVALDAQSHNGAAHIAIHGLGKVGSRIAAQAMAHGCYVSGYDIAGTKCVDAGVSEVAEARLLETPCDVLVLASVSSFLTTERARTIKAKWIVSAANAPFASEQAFDALVEQGVKYLPDVVVNPGAVICDSIEFYHPDVYKSMSQGEIDRYVSQCVASHSYDLLAYTGLFNVLPSHGVELALASTGSFLSSLNGQGRVLMAVT